jgi:prepilin-type N-terminal cleavage/methylation domain-containing protein
MTKLNKLQKKKGFTLVELLVVVAILAILLVALIPSALGYSDKARDTRAAKDIRNFNTVVEAFTATDGDYPEASLDTDNPRSIASVMQSKGINWTGSDDGVKDPWGNPYYYDIVGDYYCIASAGKNGTLDDNDDICNISGKASKKASGLDENAIPSAVPGNNPGGSNEPGHITEVPEGYIGIYYPEELASIGVDPDYPLDGNYIVMANISLSGYVDWAPIGDEASPFTGTFDGNNYVISNLTINSNQDYKGLFGCISETSEITNLGLENANINVARGNCVGGLVGYNKSGSITNCYATGSVSGNKYTGGLVGYNSTGCAIENCYTTGNVNGVDRTGGLVGENYGPITDCYTTGSVSGNNDRTGGLVGYNESGTIENCYATGMVIGYSNTGGLVGYNEKGTLTNCYATGSVSGNNNRTGGLVGQNYGTITNCYATGEVTGNSNTGGLVGFNNDAIENCYATGSVSGNNNRTGGLVGQNNGTITNCYATGEVRGADNTGGLVGQNYSSSITNSYYDKETTGQLDTGKGIPLATAQMKDQSNFSGWDFDTVWDIDPGTSYPYLIDNEQIPYPGIN